MTDELMFTPHTPQDLIWKQYGAGIMEQFPEEEWERRIKQVPLAYRDYIRARLWWKKGQEAPKKGQEDVPVTQEPPTVGVGTQNGPDAKSGPSTTTR